jgi:hypothetical protein
MQPEPSSEFCPASEDTYRNPLDAFKTRSRPDAARFAATSHFPTENNFNNIRKVSRIGNLASFAHSHPSLRYAMFQEQFHIFTPPAVFAFPFASISCLSILFYIELQSCESCSQPRLHSQEGICCEILFRACSCNSATFSN